MKIAFKNIKAQNFFEKITPAHIKYLESSKPRLQAFFSETLPPSFSRKISLIGQFLIISQVKCDETEPILIITLDDTIKFQKRSLRKEVNSKTSVFEFLSLINEKQQMMHIYFQYSALLDLWLLKLSEIINRIGFHQDFRILGKIGRGSTSTVHKIERLSDGKIMAAKVFLKSFLQSKTKGWESVSNEISLLRVLEHRNILKLQSVYESKSAIYLVTELFEGGNLLERINCSRGLSLNQTKKVMLGIAEGLSHMHSLGIMHRDLKLQNIMFRTADSFEPIIVDFGLAAFCQEQPYLFNRCGTPGYIAPQIIAMEDNQRIDVSCDIFSAGVILHILLTNRFLFEGKDSHEVYENNKKLSFDLMNKQYDRYDRQAINLMGLMLQIKEQNRISARQIQMHEFFLDLRKSCEKQQQIVSPTTTQGESFGF